MKIPVEPPQGQATFDLIGLDNNSLMLKKTLTFKIKLFIIIFIWIIFMIILTVFVAQTIAYMYISPQT